MASSERSGAVGQDSDSPSLVYQSPDTAKAFVDIRQGIPMILEQTDTMVQIIRYYVPADRLSSSGMSWLDLGCGDGALGRRLASEFPASQGIFLDHSQPMLQALQDSLSRTERVKVIQSDFSTKRWIEDLSQESNGKDEGEIDAIVSGFAIHHVSHERKQELYREIFQLLKPGGIFLNMEHVSSPSSYQDVENMFASTFCKSLAQYLQGEALDVSEEEVATTVQNDLEVDRKANILATVEEQTLWLRTIGFQNVDCYFKFMILALFGGVKPME